MNFSRGKPINKQPVIRKTVVAVPISQISRATTTSASAAPVRPYDPNRFQPSQRKGTTHASVTPAKKAPPKPAQRALAVSRGIKRKSATPQPAFSSDEEDDDNSSDVFGSDSDISRKRLRSSASSVEPSGPQRTIICEDAFRQTVESVTFMDGAAVTSGDQAFKFQSPWDEDTVTTASLQYPSNHRQEKFELKWPKNEADDYKPMEDIIETIKAVCTFYLPASVSAPYLSDETGFARRFNRAWQRQSIPDFLSTIADYNTLITTHLTSTTSSSTPNTPSTSLVATHLRATSPTCPLPLDWTRRILDQIYARTVSPAVETLKAYTNGTDYVYGELLPRFISEIFARTRLQPGQVFVDLGSGVGNVVLQAALEVGADAWGVEKMENPANLGARQAAEFPGRVALWGLQVGQVKLVKGDFTADEEILAVLRRADVVLVNNQAFTADLNEKLKVMFLDLKDGCQVASLKPFVPAGHKLTMRTYANVVNQFVQRKYEYFSNSVSWTDEGGDYYIAKVDREPWHNFMKKNGLQ